MEYIPPSVLFQSELPLFDVRSPAEYAHGHIPGARSLPLFSDDERAAIGTLYKQESRGVAIRRGLEIIGPKMADLVAQVDAQVPAGGRLQLHCWRGGMRSASVAWLLETAGFKVEVVEGGYKAWRQNGQMLFERPWKLRILTGHTGSAKTEILREMKKLGAQVIDLEGLAHHRGSSFGALGQAAQPSTEHFHNLLFTALHGVDPLQDLWLEDESVHIGKCHLPENFFAQMRQAPWVRVELPRQRRIDHIVKLYGQADRSELEEATVRIAKRLGGQRLNDALECLRADDLAGCTDHLLHYYDRAYDRSMLQRDKNRGHELTFIDESLTEIAQKILEI